MGPFLFWSLSLLLAPLLIAEAIYSRKSTPRLAAASGHTESQPAELMLLGIGESTIAGVGVARNEQALTAMVAAHLSERMGGRIGWHSFGRSGDTVDMILARLDDLPSDSFDLVLVALGVNDTTSLTSLVAWEASLNRLIAHLAERYGAPVFFADVPPMHYFTALPQPLRFMLGLRARQLDGVIEKLALQQDGVHHIAAGFRPQSRFLAEDGYHPSQAGYDHWALQLAEAMAARLRQNPFFVS